MVFSKKKKELFSKVLGLLYKGLFNNPTSISKELGVNYNSFLTNYWKPLKLHKVVSMNGLGVWSLNREKALLFMDSQPDNPVFDRSKNSKNYKKGTIRSHYYGFRVDWGFDFNKVREQVIERLPFKRGKPHTNGVWWDFDKRTFKSVYFLVGDWEIQLTSKSFNATLLKEHSFYGSDAFNNDLSAIYKWEKEVLPVITTYVGKSLLRKFKNGTKGYRFKFTNNKLHHARLNTLLANLVSKNREDFRVYDSNGFLWLIVDASNGFVEEENIHAETATLDSTKLGKLYNSNRDTGLDFYGVRDLFVETASQIKSVMESNRKTTAFIQDYAENIASHKVLNQEIGSGIRELTGVVKQLKGLGVVEKVSLLDEVKSLIASGVDILTLGDKIKVLSVKDRENLTNWYFEFKN